MNNTTPLLKNIAFGTLVALLPALAAATIIEQAREDAARQWIYHAPWFIVAWATLGIAALAYTTRVALYRRPVTFAFHVALALVLAGALVTHLAAERGHVHLHQGQHAGTFTGEDDGRALPLPFDVKLLLFDIEYNPATGLPADYHAFLQLDGHACRASMNAPVARDAYRLYLHDHDHDEMGVTLLVNRDPWGVAITRLAYILLGLSACLIAWQRAGKRAGRRRVLLALLPLAAAWTLVALLDVQTPVLRTPWLAAHVSLIACAYLGLLIIATLGLVALARPRLSRRLYRHSRHLLLASVLLLAAGIFTGAAWADLSWGRYWGWDAKETWALVTLLLYAIPLHRESLPLFRSPRAYHLYCTLALLAVLMTSIGVTFLLGGIHAYV
ncbi:MAG: cytochrome c biogenesis protein CcsA [Odoribacteraceae bacterium]|jgi:ABC-type transport system involved in cytochrome c biogenesis permease subunit|nr:cytochrome c biogenesis protein CcsA [Odoribacteraceae bacterium]